MVAEETLLTADEVNQRLPLVKSIVRDITALHTDIVFRRERLKVLRERHPAESAADSVYEQEVQQMEAELASDESRLESFAKELEQIGGVLTDAETGRVDFAGDLAGEKVWFCWQSDESELRYWHLGECHESSRLPLIAETAEPAQ